MYSHYIWNLKLLINCYCYRSMRGNYVSSAIGRVCLKRVGNICTVKAEVCPEHRQSKANYHVKVRINEDEDLIDEVKCEDCAASEGKVFFPCVSLYLH